MRKPVFVISMTDRCRVACVQNAQLNLGVSIVDLSTLCTVGTF